MAALTNSINEYPAQADPTLELDHILKEVQSEGMNAIKGIISDIEDLILKREALHKEIATDLEKVKMDINTFLATKWKEMTIKEMIELKKKEIEVEEAKVNEKLNLWKDVANLKRELRIHTADFNNKMNWSQTLTGLVDF